MDRILGRRRQKVYRFRMLLLCLWIGFIASVPGFAAPKPVRLKLWTHERHMAELTKRLVGEFNATVGRKKGIIVSVRILGDGSSKIFQNSQRRKEGPDLFSTNFNTGYADPFRSGAQIWLDDMPGFKEWKESWPSWYWIEGVTTYRGKVYAIPVQVINSRLIYNRDLFRRIGRDPRRPPCSYAEIKTIARKIVKKTNRQAFGFAYCGADNWQTEWMPSQWGEANGKAAYWDWKNGRWVMSGYYPVFRLLGELEKEGLMFPGTGFLSNDALRAQFAEGRIGMFMGEFWDIGVLAEQFPAKCDWGVGPIPTYDGKFHGKSRAMLIGGFWNINGKSRYKLQAWDVVKWFSRYEVRAKMMENGKIIDPDPEVARRYVRKIPAVKGFKEFAMTLDRDYLASYPVLPGWKMPDYNPCEVFRMFLKFDNDLEWELLQTEVLWNDWLEKYYQKYPKRRDWNTYPEFTLQSGRLGLPLLKPVFSNCK